MKRGIAAMLLAVSSLTVAAGPARAAPSNRITIRLISGKPRQVTPTYSKKHGWSHCVITLRVRVRGVRLDWRLTRGRRVRPGVGNIQVYGDRIPGAAYSKPNVSPYWLEEQPSTTVSLCVVPLFFHKRLGKHTLFLAIGKSNGVLYGHVKPARYVFTLK